MFQAIETDHRNEQIKARAITDRGEPYAGHPSFRYLIDRNGKKLVSPTDLARLAECSNALVGIERPEKLRQLFDIIELIESSCTGQPIEPERLTIQAGMLCGFYRSLREAQSND